jgi:hypothetical protein
MDAIKDAAAQDEAEDEVLMEQRARDQYEPTSSYFSS